MNYTLNRSNRKTMTIIVRDGEVIVKAPHILSQSVIDSFVISKRDWIQNKLSIYEKPGFEIEAQDAVCIFGRLFNIRFEVASCFKVKLDEQEGILYVSAPSPMSFDLLNRKLEDHFKLQLIQLLESYVPYYSGLLHLKTPPFKVRRYKRLHGRCSSKGELAFNTYLFHESVDFIKYVVLHECAHLIEFNHSRAFYEIIEGIMPDYKHTIAASKLKDSLHQDL